ncbi:MAG: alcohol dehydrogenase [Pseudomonadota bacterium]|nr:alcohol dehydrogenase [Pseudomonadota bacterium]
MASMMAAQISAPGGEFELVERPIPEPGPGQVRVRVEACGICHSDAFVKDGAFPGLTYPRVPGHEVAGVVDSVGSDIAAWKVGQRVGVGWHGGHCFHCDSCRRGDFVTCENQQVCGISYDGGYAEYMIAPPEALVAIPDALAAREAAPLLCAGITTYNALRHSGARPGDLVAVQGIGGLGHLAIQFAARMGFRTAALSQGQNKAVLAQELGAHHYIDVTRENPAQSLRRLGGARAIIATAPNSAAISSVVDGLAVDGRLLVVAASAEPISVSPFQLIMQRRSIMGWPSGAPCDSEETVQFSALAGIRPRIECFPLRDVAEAYARMIENRARFRVVLTMG